MRTKLIIGILLLLIAIAAAAAWWHYSRIACCVEPAAEETIDAESIDGELGGVPEPIWTDADRPELDASPEGLYDDLKAASEDAHRKPSLKIEGFGSALPPPTRSEDDDPA